MKTIDEAMNFDANATNPSNPLDFGMGYIKGVKFAQRWIPVTEELPTEYKNSGFSKQVICKTKSESFMLFYYDFECKKFTCPEYITVTDWRPIELK